MDFPNFTVNIPNFTVIFPNFTVNIPNCHAENRDPLWERAKGQGILPQDAFTTSHWPGRFSPTAMWATKKKNSDTFHWILVV